MVSYMVGKREAPDALRACEMYQLETLRNLPCKRIQCDEIWCFVGSKESNVPPMRRGDKSCLAAKAALGKSAATAPAPPRDDQRNRVRSFWLRVTPAMQAAIRDRVWTLEEIARLADSPAESREVLLVAHQALEGTGRPEQGVA